MIDPVVSDFFAKRKEDWLKAKTKASMEQEEVQQLRQECEARFSWVTWLPDAAKRAGQISLSSHPCTFTHPSARKNKKDYVSSVITNKCPKNDGLLRSGNLSVELDALGNAAVLDVHKFLMLRLTDGKTLLAHIEENSEQAQILFEKAKCSAGALREGFLAIKATNEASVTSSKLKQVYFPVNDDYHLLSILTPSGIVFSLRDKINAFRFSDNHKLRRELKKKNEFSKEGFCEVLGLTEMGYGGTKPQNISVLNSQYGGKAYLLPSMPPQITQREYHFPKVDFFVESLPRKQSRELFQRFHRLLEWELNNYKVRQYRDELISDILDMIVERMFAIRSVSESQSFVHELSLLPEYQQIWLIHTKADQRENEDEWLTTLLDHISRWFMICYRSILGKKAIALGEAEHNKVKEIVESYKEFLR